MGYERKRGKLADLNALLRGGSRDRFSLIVGETAVLSTVKYVITLDTDTQLPRDAARQFVGDDGASAESSAVRRPGDSGSLRAMASCSHACREPTRHEPIAVCATQRERTGHRSLYARRFRCVPGPVR